jgi:hypothetical protein
MCSYLVNGLVARRHAAHGPVEGEMGYYYRHLDPQVRLVAISDAQRDNAPDSRGLVVCTTRKMHRAS